MQILTVIFFSAVGLQLLYLTIFLIALKRKRPAKVSALPPVSVIVCAHDEEENLKALVPLLEEQDYPQFEIIIVNDRSNDGTYDYLLNETKNSSRLRMVNVDQVPGHINGKKFGITLGIKAATHEWVLLLDADCRPAGKEWIHKMSAEFVDQNQFVLGVSPYLKTGGFLNLFIRFESIITAIQYASFALLRNPYMGVGRNLAYRKSLFLEKKGFNQFLGITGGDDDLFVNLYAKGSNTSVQLSPESLVYSIAKTSWRSFQQQKLRHLSVGKLYRPNHRILLGIFTLSWIVTWLSGVPLMIIDITNWPVTAAFLVRIFVLFLVIRTTLSQLKLRFELWALPVLDFLYSIYYISTGLVALLTKKIQWRK